MKRRTTLQIGQVVWVASSRGWVPATIDGRVSRLSWRLKPHVSSPGKSGWVITVRACIMTEEEYAAWAMIR